MSAKITKYTGGRWSYMSENGNNPRIVSTAIDPGTGRPCVVADLTCSMRTAGPVETTAQETEANCILMAAGPQMYEALKAVESDLMAYCDGLHKKGPRMAISFEEAKARLENVRAAISAAE